VLAELEQALAQVFPSAMPSNIQIRREFSQGFPPLLMQRSHLSEALVNLLQNAREALQDTGTLLVTAQCSRDYTVTISVADTGPGIAPDRIERIFEAYYTTKEKGTGLGLSIVKHNVELYGGRIRVESVLGKGACFTLTFPAKTLMKLNAT
jgi:signal transduction histidine kinase